MTKQANFMDHLDEFNRLLRELDAIAPKIKEEDKSILSLVFLALSYEHLKTTLIHRKGTIIIDA